MEDHHPKCETKLCFKTYAYNNCYFPANVWDLPPSKQEKYIVIQNCRGCQGGISQNCSSQYSQSTPEHLRCNKSIHHLSPIPSGKHTKNYGKSPCYQWENQLFLWPFSIANCNTLPEGKGSLLGIPPI